MSNKALNEELESVESLFEAAKVTMDRIGAEIRELRVNVEATTSTVNVEAKLERLRKEVRTLKYKIPYSLIYPSPPPPSNPPVGDDRLNIFDDDPTVVWQPGASSSSARYYTNKAYRVSRTKCLEITGHNPDFYFSPHPNAPTNPSNDELEESLISLDDWSRQILYCLSCFPEYVIIKRAFLFNCVRALYEESPSSSIQQQLKELDGAMNNVVLAEGFVKPIYKKSTSSLFGYWMDDGPYSFLTRYHQEASPPYVHVSPSPAEEQEILYSDNGPIIDKTKSLRALLLGKWHRSLPINQHIEVSNPDLFYHGMEKLTQVRYISLRGISMIPELPQFITELKKLQILDCKACHNLEVIPDNINKLWRTLTHLDLSECYLLDHMPTTLSELLHLEVLKGFHVGEPNQLRKSCSLRNLTKLSRLQKLHINTSLKGFPNSDHLSDLQKFQSLRNLGISWRACLTHDDESTVAFASTARRALTHKDSTGGGGGDEQRFMFDLEKLDLRCVPNTVTRVWLNPAVFKGLKKLYITGGNFFDLGQKLHEPKEENLSVTAEENQWTVEILRLKHLSELKMDKSEVDNLFPELISLEKVDCSNLTSINCDDNGIWLKSRHPPPSMPL